MVAPPVHIDEAGDVAVIVIDNPPVNALSHHVRVALRDVLERLRAAPGVRALVLACDGRTFVAGADIREFDGPAQQPLTGDITALLDAFPKPTVCALHGTALGGGFELALASHERVIAPDGFVGLPEVLIGLIPGAGGTQRLPRITGPITALELIVSGRHVPAAEAMALGLVDEVATDPRAVAIARAHELARTGQRPGLAARKIPDFDQAVFHTNVAEVRRRAHGALAPLRAADAVSFATALPIEEGLARERAISIELRNGPQSRALRYLFHAERLAAKLGGEVRPWPIRRVGIVEADGRGAEFARILTEFGLDVTLVRAPAGALERSATGGSGTRHPLQHDHALQALSDVDFVVAALPDDLAASTALFRAISEMVRRDTVLATTTATFDIELIADAVSDAPERVIGLHLCAAGQQAVEIAQPRRAWPKAIATGVALAKRVGWVPVITGASAGLIGERLCHTARHTADLVIGKDVPPAAIDTALRRAGLASFASTAKAGVEGGLAITVADTAADLHAALVNEAARLLGNGIARRPSDIDVIMVAGYGYPCWRGGPMYEADVIGVAKILYRLESLHLGASAEFAPAPLLEEMLRARRRFADLNLTSRPPT
jgi:3-hydroxyacyl-CoA dehydrogenase